MRVVILGATANSVDLPTHFADDLTVVASTLTDATVHGLRFCPAIDALTMPATEPVAGGAVSELADYHVDAEWFPMTERTLAAAVLRTRLLGLGYSLAQATEAMAKRFDPGFDILPLSNQAVETFAIVAGEAWPIHRWLAEGQPTNDGFVLSGIDAAQAAPGVLAAIRAADLVIMDTEDPAEFGWRGCLSLQGVKDAVMGTRAHLVAFASSANSQNGRDLLNELPTVRIVSDLTEALSLGPVPRQATTSTIWDT